MFRFFLGISILAAFLGSCSQKETGFMRSDKGIVLTILDGNQEKTYLAVDVLGEKIARIRATIQPDFSSDSSLVVIGQGNHFDAFQVIDSVDNLYLITAEMKIKVDKSNGRLSFFDKNGNLKLQEKVGGKIFANRNADKHIQIGQIFESPSDEGFYGLGQHQHGYMNYKGKNVDLTQHNIVAVVPFLYSSRNYGLLWDNTSITRFGDPREFQQISRLNLLSKENKSGGITETWFQKGKQVAQKQVNSIDYQYLETESYLRLPKADSVDQIVYEGKISSDIPGEHHFLLYASSYFKLWIDGELIFDKWRQNWNPWSNPFELNMEKGKEYDFRIEWKPNSGYMSLKHLDPWTQEDQNRLTLTSEDGEMIDYYYISGVSADDVIGGYRKLTGKSRILPKSAYGFWQSRERYKTQDEILNIAGEYRKREIPIDNIVLDWSYWPEDKWGSHEFDSIRFPDPKAMNDLLKDKFQMNIMISVWPKFYKGIEHYKEMASKGYLFMNNIKKGRIDWIAKGYQNTFYDVFNPGARKLFWDQMDEHLYTKGFHAWWLDATEPDMHSNLSIKDRIENMQPTALGPGSQYFNAYSLMNSKAVFEGQMAHYPDERVFILTRSAFAGQQRFGSVTWSGDIVSRWSDLKDQISAGVNFSLSGLPYWTMDIGGFATEERYSNDKTRSINDLDEWRELNTRWFQFGAFCPIFRSHGQYPFREIFNISPEGHPAYNSMVYYDKLRYQLMPYIYSLGAKTYFDDYTIMRGLVMDFVEDKECYGIDDQFMFGNELMICPVTEMHKRQRAVYLPKKVDWYDFYSGQIISGGQTISANAPYERMPIYVKGGSILVAGENIVSTKESNLNNLDIYVYAGKNATFYLYDDNGKDNTYIGTDHFCKIKLTYDDKAKSLVIEDREGSFYTQGQTQEMNIHYVHPGHALGFNAKDAGSKAINYIGARMIVALDQ